MKRIIITVSMLLTVSLALASCNGGSQEEQTSQIDETVETVADVTVQETENEEATVRRDC